MLVVCTLVHPPWAEERIRLARPRLAAAKDGGVEAVAPPSKGISPERLVERRLQNKQRGGSWEGALQVVLGVRSGAQAVGGKQKQAFQRIQRCNGCAASSREAGVVGARGWGVGWGGGSDLRAILVKCTDDGAWRDAEAFDGVVERDGWRATRIAQQHVRSVLGRRAHSRARRNPHDGRGAGELGRPDAAADDGVADACAVATQLPELLGELYQLIRQRHARQPAPRLRRGHVCSTSCSCCAARIRKYRYSAKLT